MKTLLMKLRFVVFVLTFLVAVPSGWAQTDAALSGTAYDTTGAVLPGVSIKLTNKAQGMVRNAQTNEAGVYQFSFLAPGAYSVEATMPGFKTLTRTDIQLAVAQNLRRDLNLELGNVSDAVTVTAAGESVNTETADLGAVIDNKKVVEMPLNGRVFFSLPTLTPGVVPPAQGSGLGYRGGFNVAGSCEGCNNFVLNGMDNNDNNKQIPNFRPSIDAIGEFNILTGVYSAQYGYGSGGQIIVTTKSGSNEFHGSAYDFLRNQAVWTARNFFQSGLPAFRRNQFGGTLGGPIKRDRTFFFFSYEGLRLATSISQATTVPTPAMQSGDFSSLLPGKIIRDPLTGNPFPGNIIPGGRFSDVGAALMRFYPAPTLPTSAGAQPSNNYLFNETRTELYNTLSLKLDHTFSSTDSGFLTANYYNDDAVEPQVNSCSSSYLPGFGCLLRQRSEVYGLSETHIFSPTKVNEVRVAFNETLQPAINQIAYVPFWSKFGIKPYVETGSELPREGTPGVSITGFQSFPAPAPFRRADPHWQFTDMFSWTFNKHTTKMGANLSHFSTNDVQANPTGSMTFTNTSAGPTTGYALSDMLLGLPASTSNAPYAYKAYLRAANISFFVQDDYKVSARLTLNLGLRWEVNTPPIDKGRHLTNFDPVKGIPITQSNPAPNAPGGAINVGFPGLRVFNYDYHDFAPRLGFAWQPFGGGKTVLRGGLGTFFQNFGLWNGTGNIRFGAPYTINNTYTSSVAQPITLSNPFPAANAVTSNSMSGLDPNYKNQRVYEWSFGVQRQLSSDLMAEVTYFASTGNHLQMTHNLNQPASGPGTPAQVNARRPYPIYGTVNYSEWGGVSHYHSMAAKLQKQYGHGLSFLASYTLSKSIDDLNGPTDQHNFLTARGPSTFDTPQRFVISPVYELPFGPGKMLGNTGLMGAIAGGWQLSPLFQWQTGNPLTAILSGNFSNSGGTRDRPDLIGDPNANAPHTAQKWFDTSVFALRPANGVAGATYSFGNEGIGVIRAPGLVQLDISVVRNFQIREKMKAQFRVELFNVLNHTNFGYPNVTADSAQFGTISSALDPRQSQFALKISF